VIGSVTVGYGQYLRSYRKIADDCEYLDNKQVLKWRHQRVARMVKWLESEGMIGTLETTLGTLFTISNFQKFQDFKSYRVGQLGTRLGTDTGQIRDNNNHLNQSNQSLGRRQIPDGWAPNDKHRTKAKASGLDIDREAERFRNHATSQNRTLVNWDAGFNNWLLKAEEFQRPTPAIQTSGPPPLARRPKGLVS